MLLRSSPASPFGRKVKVVAKMVGLMDGITVMPTDTLSPADSIREQNPLGKIPCLITAEGDSIYDSAVIVDYLDGLAGGDRVIPVEFGARIKALTGQALADGLMEAALLVVYENRFRTDGERSPRWVEHQLGKVDRALAAFASHAPSLLHIDIVAIALACALEYMDFRSVTDWRGNYPDLEPWLADFNAAVPFFSETAPK